MARITADARESKEALAIPPNVYLAHIQKKEFGPSKSGNNMFTLTWQIEEGEHKGVEIPFDFVTVAGTNKDGDPVNIGRLCKLVNATKIAWGCVECSSGDRIVEIINGTGPEVDKGENGLERGFWFCPSCRGKVRLDFDDDSLLSARCKIRVNQRKDEQSDKMRNNVTDYYPVDWQPAPQQQRK